MQIVGLEVIKNNPVSRRIAVAPPGKLELTYGDTFRLSVQFDYQGPARSLTLYGSLGKKGATFDEIISNEYEFDAPDSVFEFTPCQVSVNIPITSAIDAGSNYDLMAKVKEYPGETEVRVENVIDITGISPTFELLEETIYPYAYIYEGPHDGGAFTFNSDAFTPSSWIAGRLAAAVEDEIRKTGGRMLEMRVYVDKSPLFWSNWRIEVVSAPPQTGTGIAMPIGIVWWAVAILAVLAIALIIVLTWAAKEIAGLFKRNPALEDVKPGWSKETLIMTIHDSEEYWERTPTPDETLQAMSEEELREYLDEMAEAEIPPETAWWPIAVGVGVAAIGIGVAMAMRKDKE